MSQHQVIISDDANALIDRKETDIKLSRLEVYITKAKKRLDVLDLQLRNLSETDVDIDMVKKGIESMIKAHDSALLEGVDSDGP